MQIELIPHRRLGRLNRQVSQLGLGCAELSSCLYGRENTEASAIGIVHRALELGIDFFDTSPLYGESEARLGLALRGVPRDSFFLATKTGTGVNPHNYSRDHTFRSIEKSLRLLGTDHLDLVHIHDLAHSDAELAFSHQGALGALLELKSQGVIGGIGVGVREHLLLQTAIDRDEFDAILTYLDFNLVRQTARDNLFPGAVANDKAIILGSPLAMGWLSDRPWDVLLKERNANPQQPDVLRARQVRDWAEQQKVSALHLAVQFVLREPRLSVVLIGSSDVHEVETNVHAATTPLPDSLWEELEKIFCK